VNLLVMITVILNVYGRLVLYSPHVMQFMFHFVQLVVFCPEGDLISPSMLINEVTSITVLYCFLYVIILRQ